MGGLTKSQIILPKPPADIDAEFRRAVTRAIELADAAHRRDRRDLTALHDLGTAQGLQASWTASVEGRVMAAFGAARKAFDAEETVLNRDPRNVGAGTVVGTYRYAVASLGIASRMVAYLAGFGGDKTRAMTLLESAGRRGDSRFEARTALVLIYSREGRHGEAYALLGQMAAEYPRNRILVLEQAAAAIRAGRAPEAEALLTRGLSALDQDSRRKIPGERALWLYKRGLARLNQNHQETAAADFTSALGSAPEPWVHGRIHLELGKLADLAGQRTAALARYRTARDMGRSANDPLGVADADRLLRRPFSMGSD
jgi:tetratricopeptide (TPR) repeat protein